MHAVVRTYHIHTFNGTEYYYEAPPTARDAVTDEAGTKFLPIRRFDVVGETIRLRRPNSTETIIPLGQVSRIESQEEAVMVTV